FPVRSARRGCERQAGRTSPLDRNRPPALLGTCTLLWRGQEPRRRARRRRKGERVMSLMATPLPMQQLALFFLAAGAAGGVAWVFIYPLLSGERDAERRMQSVAKPDRVGAKVVARASPKVRRDQLEETLKDLEARSKKRRSPPLAARIEQAGLTLSKQHFMIDSAALGVLVFAAVMVVGGGLLPAAGLAFGASFGLPQWVLSHLRKRRRGEFLENFPDAVDIIVRGIKAGLPLLDSMKIIVNDAPEPIKSEFRA